ncbi:MAG: type II toxin-antitoxin system HipA family toxin [Cohaesibacteraceae bacterium]|nr:type II toxin-antitoxin system HipA family toxin [Cohaesibacteraceae bacterium]
MTRRSNYIPLDVYINSRLVGHLARAKSGAVDFRYDRNWLNWEHSFPISLSLPLREDRFSGETVIAVFDNLLPDNDHIRRRIAERKQAAGVDAFSLLSVIGRDCVGAMQFLPQGLEPGKSGAIDARKIDEAGIEALLKGLAANPLGLGDDQDFRISLAGAQEKTALLHREGQWHIPHGDTATTHIFKPAIGVVPGGVDLSGSVENEHLCMQLVAAMGLPVASTQMAVFGETNVLIVERFDRKWAHDNRLLRLPQEDFCQALSVHSAQKYERDGGPGIVQLINLLRGSDNPGDDQKKLMKAQIIFWLLAATDGHAKNFSIFLHPGAGYSLTPLYDIMSAQPVYDAGQLPRTHLKLSMAVGQNRHCGIHDMTPRYFIETAKACGMGESVVRGIFDEIKNDSDDAIGSTLSALPAEFPQKLAGSIIGGFKSRLRLL